MHNWHAYIVCPKVSWLLIYSLLLHVESLEQGRGAAGNDEGMAVHNEVALPFVNQFLDEYY